MGHSQLQVYKDGDGMLGIVDFALEDDMKYAIRKLDDSEFERGCYVRVKVGLNLWAIYVNNSVLHVGLGR